MLPIFNIGRRDFLHHVRKNLVGDYGALGEPNGKLL